MAGRRGGQADLKKVKAAATNRARKGRFWQEVQYYLWGAGSIGALVLALVYMVLNPARGPFQIPVNDQYLISHVNRNAKTWRASSSTFFKGWTIGDVKLLEGISVSALGGSVAGCALPNTAVPDRFDARERWSECFKTPLYNMGNCTGSWAVASASALADRFCISNPSEFSNLRLSPQQLLSCDNVNRGCAGGDIDTVWKYIEDVGLYTEECFPYQADSAVSCRDRCNTEEVSLKAERHCMVSGNAAIKQEVLQSGPVVAFVTLSDDFLVYRGGLYQEMPTATVLVDRKRQRIIHAVKIIGWGSADGKPYWLIQNSWGEDWGEGGYARVAASGIPDQREGTLIESYAVAGIPASRKFVDEPPPENEEELPEFEEEYNYAEGMDEGDM